jgi:pyruvate formate lyase activating enzyme
MPEIMIHKERCIGCGNYLKACTREAIISCASAVSILRKKCDGCGCCANICPSKTLILMGKQMSVGSVMEVVRKDILYYKKSGGGVTFSGGEATLQILFLKQLLESCHKEGIHTVVDTAGEVDFENLRLILPFTDLFLYDIKAGDSNLHRLGTAKNNQRILENLKQLANAGASIQIRIPVIPGFNDIPEEIEHIAVILKDIPFIAPYSVNLLGFHRLGSAKYENLGRRYKAVDLIPPNKEKLDKLAEIFWQFGISVEVM